MGSSAIRAPVPSPRRDQSACIRMSRAISGTVQQLRPPASCASPQQRQQTTSARRSTTMVTSTPSATSRSTIRPFQFHASDEALADLRRRIAATNWPDGELVTDASQGVQYATMRKLARYWETEHDWRKIEARLNAIPQFITN